MITKQAIEIVEKTDRPYKWGGKHEHQEALQHLLTIVKRVEGTDKNFIEYAAEQVHKAYCAYKKDVHKEEYWTKGDYSKLEDIWKEADRYSVRAVLTALKRYLTGEER